MEYIFRGTHYGVCLSFHFYFISFKSQFHLEFYWLIFPNQCPHILMQILPIYCAETRRIKGSHHGFFLLHPWKAFE